MGSKMKEKRATPPEDGGTALSRIRKLEFEIQRIKAWVVELQERVDKSNGVVNAISHLVGTDDVLRVAAEITESQKQAERDKVEQSFTKLVNEGHLVETKTIGLKSFLVGHVDKAGVVGYREYLPIADFVPELQAKIVDQLWEGVVIPLGDDAKFVVEGAYNVVEHPVPKAAAVTIPATDALPAVETPPTASE